MTQSIQDHSKAQFGRSAESYVTSTVHAKGASLPRLVELANPQVNWHMLDVATGGGHTALAFAPHVAKVTASDITPQMLEAASKHIAKQGVENVVFESADAVDMPFADGTFDCVTCRIAPHHFPDIFKFLQESARVLKTGGTFGLVDNIVPDGAAGDYVNAFERLRDPSHVGCLSAELWQQELFAAGFDEQAIETMRMAMDFDSWATRMHVSDDNRTRLKVMLKQAPDAAASSLTPEFQGDKITFYLQRLIVVATKR